MQGTPSDSATNYSFVMVGCNRVQSSDTTGNSSTANLCQLNRLFSEVMAIQPLPDYLFMVGDLIYGFFSDTLKLAHQLTSWKAVYLTHPISSTSVQLVVLPGNHEMQDASKNSFPAAERTWVRTMSSYIPGNNGPLPGQFPQDSLQTDQSRLSYSFDHKSDHFVLLNTDPAGLISHVPAAWVGEDLAAARTKGVRHIFCFGHKPAYPSPLTPGNGLVINNCDVFWPTLENNRCEAMFAAHNHLWGKIQPDEGKTWQIIGGNGGSSPESPWTNPYYGYTLVNVNTDGTVIVKSIGHPISASSYTACLPGVPTVLKDSVNINYPIVLGIEKYPDILSDNFTVFPNPNDGTFTTYITVQNAAEISIQLINTIGIPVYKKQYAALPGLNSLFVDTANLPKGVYFMQLDNGFTKANRKIIIE